MPGFGGFAAVYPGYQAADERDVQTQFNRTKLRDAQLSMAGRAALGRAMLDLGGAQGTPAAPDIQYGGASMPPGMTPPTPPQTPPIYAPPPALSPQAGGPAGAPGIPVPQAPPGAPASPADRFGVWQGEPAPPGMPGGGTAYRPVMPAAPPMRPPAPVAPRQPPAATPTGGPPSRPSAAPGGQQGPLDWRSVVQAVARANPGAPPEVIAAAVDEAIPMMNSQAQAEWRMVMAQLQQERVSIQRERADEQEGKRAESDADVKEIVDGMVAGRQPPTTTGFYGKGPAIRAEAERRGFDLAKANLEWQAAQRQVASLHGPQITRFRAVAGSVANTIDEVKSLAQEMQLRGIPLTNQLELSYYIKATGANSPNGQLAARYMTAINTVKEEFAQMAAGGYAPIGATWDLAQQQISGNYDVNKLGASLDEIQRLIHYRLKAYDDLGGGAENRYQQKPAQSPGTDRANASPKPSAAIIMDDGTTVEPGDVYQGHRFKGGTGKNTEDWEEVAPDKANPPEPAPQTNPREPAKQGDNKQHAGMMDFATGGLYRLVQAQGGQMPEWMGRLESFLKADPRETYQQHGLWAAILPALYQSGRDAVEGAYDTATAWRNWDETTPTREMVPSGVNAALMSMVPSAKFLPEEALAAGFGKPLPKLSKNPTSAEVDKLYTAMVNQGMPTAKIAKATGISAEEIKRRTRQRFLAVTLFNTDNPLSQYYQRATGDSAIPLQNLIRFTEGLPEEEFDKMLSHLRPDQMEVYNKALTVREMIDNGATQTQLMDFLFPKKQGA